MQEGRYIAGAHIGEPLTAAAAIGIASAAAGLIGQMFELFGPGSKPQGPVPYTEDHMSPALRAWWNAGKGGKWLSDWLTANCPDTVWLSTVDEMLPLYYTALFMTGKSIGWWAPARTHAALKDASFYRPGLTEQAFAGMGVDFEASADNWVSDQYHGTVGGLWKGWVILPGNPPQQVGATFQHHTAQALNAGQPLTPGQQAAVISEETAIASGDSTNLLIGAAVLGAGLLLFGKR